MHVMTPPLSSLQRDTARAGLLQAMKHKTHVGIRPTEQYPRAKHSAGIKAQGFTTLDADIERARATWPLTQTFSVFGSDNFSETPPPNTENNWLIADTDGCQNQTDGCFSNCEEFGQFSVPPSIDLQGASC